MIHRIFDIGGDNYADRITLIVKHPYSREPHMYEAVGASHNGVAFYQHTGAMLAPYFWTDDTEHLGLEVRMADLDPRLQQAFASELADWDEALTLENDWLTGLPELTVLDALFNESRDSGDMWGAAMSWTCDLCEYMYCHSMSIPSELKFSPGMGVSEPGEWYGLEEARTMTPEALYEHALRLNKLIDALKLDEQDY